MQDTINWIRKNGISDYILLRGMSSYINNTTTIPLQFKEVIIAEIIPLICLFLQCYNITISIRNIISILFISIIGLLLQYDSSLSLYLQPFLYFCFYSIIRKTLKKISFGSCILLSSILQQFYIKAFTSKDLYINPIQFAIKTIFIQYMIFKEIKQLFNQNKHTYHHHHHYSQNIISLISGILSILLITNHLCDITKIIINGELQKLIILSFTYPNIAIVLYWFITLITFFIGQYYLSHMMNNIKQIIRRKIFHFLASILYIPSIIYMNKELLITLSLIILYFFIMIELVRNIKAYSIQSTTLIRVINNYLKENIDNRDDSRFIITHIFLMTGIISSLFYNSQKEEKEYSFIGIAVLGIGDSFCSFIGIYFGRTFIYPPTKRTLEGSIGGLLFTVIFFIVILKRLLYVKELLSLIVIFIYEGITLEIDNLVLPLLSNMLLRI